jgi:hypothetical protein
VALLLSAVRCSSAHAQGPAIDAGGDPGDATAKQPPPAVPASTPAVGAPRPRTFGHDGPPEWNAGVPEAEPDCEPELARAGVVVRPARLPVHTEHGMQCGAPQVVTYVRGPGRIAYDPPPVLTCKMALALAAFEVIVQDEAERTLHSPVVRIEQLGTYNCRPMAEHNLVSEHSYANAIDLSRFTLKNGRSFTVLHDFDTGAGPPSRPEGAFLRAVSQRADDERVFSLVLTPFWDALHKNHFHMDLAPYRVDGSHPRAP